MMPEKTFEELIEALEPKNLTRAERRRKKHGWKTCPICEKSKKCQDNGICLGCNRKMVKWTPDIKARLG